MRYEFGILIEKWGVDLDAYKKIINEIKNIEVVSIFRQRESNFLRKLSKNRNSIKTKGIDRNMLDLDCYVCKYVIFARLVLLQQFTEAWIYN